MHDSYSRILSSVSLLVAYTCMPIIMAALVIVQLRSPWRHVFIVLKVGRCSFVIFPEDFCGVAATSRINPLPDS